MKPKHFNELMDEAKKLAADINGGKNPQWTPMNRAETQIFVSAWAMGYEAAQKEKQP